jgi:lysophospholipase L1-like esterase
LKLLGTAIATLALLIGGGFLISQNQSETAQAAAAWTVFSDQFSRTDGTINNNWVERVYDTANISSGQLVLNNGAGTDALAPAVISKGVLRPMSEAYHQQTLTIDIPNAQATTQQVVLLGRVTDDTATFSAGCGQIMFDGGVVRAGACRVIEGSVTQGPVDSSSLPTLEAGHTYRLKLDMVDAASYTGIGVSVYDITVDPNAVISDAWTSMSNTTAVFGATGTAGITYVRSTSGASVAVDNFTYTTTDEPNPVTYATVPRDDSNLVYSPYTWYDMGSDYSCNFAGCYIKLAFTGTTLGLDITTAGLYGNTILHAYVDGATSPLEQNFNGSSDSKVIFTDSLPMSDHYASIYVSSVYGGSGKWVASATGSSVKVRNVLLSDGASILSTTDTPVAEKTDGKVIFYGDSITEYAIDIGVAIGEKSYATVLGQNLNMEYGQLGMSNTGWNYSSGVPDFYTGDKSVDSWSNYFLSTPRLGGDGKYIGGAPTAIFNNMGINDANNDSGSATVRSDVVGWLADARTASDVNTEICIILPFGLGGQTSNAYYQGITDGYADYVSANPTDRNVCLINLGAVGRQVVMDNNPNDNLHLNHIGAEIMAGLINDALEPLAPSAINTTATGEPDEIKLSWTAPTVDSNGITHFLDGYLVQYRESSSEIWTIFDAVESGVTSVDIDGLIGGLSYDFRVTTTGVGLIAGAPYAEIDGVPESDPDASAAFTTYAETHQLGTNGVNDQIEYTVDKDFRLFSKVQVDGADIALGVDYTVADGSTVVTLLNSYLNGLSVDDHELAVVFTDGLAFRGTFTILAANNGGGNNNGSNSGDNNSNGSGSVNTPSIPSAPNTGVSLMRETGVAIAGFITVIAAVAVTLVSRRLLKGVK